MKRLHTILLGMLAVTALLALPVFAVALAGRGQDPKAPSTTRQLWIGNGSRRIYGELFTPQDAQRDGPVAIIAHGFGAALPTAVATTTMLWDVWAIAAIASTSPAARCAAVATTIR